MVLCGPKGWLEFHFSVIPIATVSGNSLAVQWLRLCAFVAMGWGAIPGRGAEIPQAARHGKKKKKKKKDT